jgi:hypothetical protein
VTRYRGVPVNSRVVTRFARAGIVAVLAVGAFTLNVSVIVNATGALAVSYLPGVLQRDLDVPLPPWAATYVAVAVFLHGIGMVALYDDVWWWDHLTHVLSASVVAGVGYVAVTAFDEHHARVYIPQPYLGAYVVAFTVAAGVVWEVGEETMRVLAIALGFDPVLIVYGLEDSILDLVFNAAGGVVVALFGQGTLRDTAREFAARLQE